MFALLFIFIYYFIFYLCILFIMYVLVLHTHVIYNLTYKLAWSGEVCSNYVFFDRALWSKSLENSIWCIPTKRVERRDFWEYVVRKVSFLRKEYYLVWALRNGLYLARYVCKICHVGVWCSEDQVARQWTEGPGRIPKEMGIKS